MAISTTDLRLLDTDRQDLVLRMEVIIDELLVGEIRRHGNSPVRHKVELPDKNLTRAEQELILRRYREGGWIAEPLYVYIGSEVGDHRQVLSAISFTIPA